jgi:hypothetical protein
VCVFISGKQTVFHHAMWKVTKDGGYHPRHPLPGPGRRFFGTPLCFWPSGREISQVGMMEWAPNFLRPALLAISFCHCKNVTIKAEPFAPKVLAKRRRRYGEWTPNAIHTLQIEPIKKVLHESGGTGLKNQLHICRGHFADYREGRGLFGKHHGIYWWDAWLRDASHPHQYSVSPPNQPTKRD